MNAKIDEESQTTNKTFVDVCLASGGKFAAQIERVRNNIVAEFRETFEAHEQLLNHAINQADALAWQTEYPHLIFPLLATEKIQAAAQWSARQQFLQRENSLYAVAA